MTAYEAQTALAFLWFARTGCDYVVVETGMGGRLDATNVLERVCLSVFASISMDHMGFLGDTLEDIACQKAGILKAGCPAVTVRQQPEAAGVLEEAARRKGNHIITSTIELASVYYLFGLLEEEGWRVSYIPVDEYGRLNQEALLSRLDDETVLVSVMYVNNEIGSVNPIGGIGAMIKEKSPGTLFHVDAIQAYGKYRINPKREQIDLLSASGHKIHGPKGAGFLYVKNGVKIAPTVFGGGQQRGLRSGTHNVPGIAGLGEAARLIYENHEEKIAAMYRLKRLFVELVSALPDVRVNGYTDERSAPHIVSVSFGGVRSEVLLHALEEKGIYVSSGSACSSNHPAVSGTLRGIGLERRFLDSTLRFSFSIFTTEEEIRYCAEVLKELLPVLRRYRRM